MSLSRGSIIFEPPPPNDPFPREDHPPDKHRGNAPPPYVFCIFEFIFRYLLASRFGFAYYVLTQKIIGFILADLR